MIDFEKYNIRTLMLDMDGVLWKDAQPIGNLPAIFSRIKELGLNAVLATNNATRSTEQYLEKLAGMGVTLEPWQIGTSGHACVYYLKTHYPAGTRVHVMGEPGLMATIEEAGYLLADSDVKVVIAGVDRSVNYKRIEVASTLIRNGAEFLGTNPDKTFPTPHGLIPGAGSIIAAVATAAETEPLFMGKPNRFLLDLSLERVNGSMSEALMVGDRLETDILAAQNAGCKSCLVLSGVTTREQADAWQPKPDFITADLAELVGA
jgi:4-nitrophenyl phosphatase